MKTKTFCAPLTDTHTHTGACTNIDRASYIEQISIDDTSTTFAPAIGFTFFGVLCVFLLFLLLLPLLLLNVEEKEKKLIFHVELIRPLPFQCSSARIERGHKANNAKASMKLAANITTATAV